VAKRFRVILEGLDDSSGTFVRVPDAVMKAFDGRIRVPVRVAVNGVEHRTTICDMGMGPAIGIPATVRRAARVERGDRIMLSLEIDREERKVDIPPDFARDMTATERRTYDSMSYTHRKEYVQWIEAAKKPETRVRRIGVARDKLRERAKRKA
jgi:antitoxin component of MazEF toxin-antitoxin module